MQESRPCAILTAGLTSLLGKALLAGLGVGVWELGFLESSQHSQD